MANTKNNTAAKKAETAKKETAVAATAPEITIEEVVRPVVPKEIDPNQFITVRNGFHGQLIYKSARTGELFVWNEYGAIQEMELRELRNAKSAHKKIFENNWFMFDEDWVIDYLGVRQYYKNAIPIDGFDSIFTKSPAELKKLIGTMSDGQKKSVAYRARQLILDGEIDSRKTITALEETLGIELVEQ